MTEPLERARAGVAKWQRAPELAPCTTEDCPAWISPDAGACIRCTVAAKAVSSDTPTTTEGTA